MMIELTIIVTTIFIIARIGFDLFTNKRGTR